MAKISDEAVLKATGKSREQWFDIIEAEEKGIWKHKKIVDFLGNQFKISFWWQQTIAGDYEKAKDRRKIGQTLESGFQIGVRKTINCTKEKLKNFIFSSQGISYWLGDHSEFQVEKGYSGTSNEGIEYEIRVVGTTHLRLTYHPRHWKMPSTLQIRISANSSSKAVLAFHQEKLASEAEREIMRDHWMKIADKIKQQMEQIEQIE